MTTAVRPVPTVHGRPTQSRRLLRRLALAGIALFIVGLGTFAPEFAPDPGTATASDIRHYAADNATTIQVNALAALASAGLLVTFVSCLAQQIRDVRPHSTAPNVMVPLGAVIAAQILYQAAVLSMFGRPEQLAEISDQAIVTLYQMTAIADWLYTLTVLVPCMILVATYSWHALRCRLIARWVPWAGFAIAAAGATTAIGHVVPSIELDPIVIPLFGWWLWPLAVGGAALARWWSTRHHPAAPPTPLAGASPNT
jgi:hypothetical protein